MAAPLHVLVVEDSPNSRDLLCEMLAVLGYKAQTAATAEDGIALLKTTRFDVLFADINLPSVSGIDLAKTAITIVPDIKIVFASGYGFLLTDKTEFDFFLLPKPYGLEQLRYALDHVAGSLIGDSRLA
jgi:CheY-like chemotaxis protein